MLDFARTRVSDGGGVVWGSFLKASLIDEISHIVVPVADGSIGTPTVFDAEQGHTKRKAKALRSKSIKRFPGGVFGCYTWSRSEWLNVGTRNMSIWSKDELRKVRFPGRPSRDAVQALQKQNNR